MDKCYKCKKNAERMRSFTYIRDIDFTLCHNCYDNITKSFCEDKSHRESFLEALGLPECDEKKKQQERTKRLAKEFGVLGHDKPTHKFIGECDCCHATGQLWLQVVFLDYEANASKPIQLCYPCTEKYNLEQSELLKSYITEG